MVVITDRIFSPLFWWHQKERFLITVAITNTFWTTLRINRPWVSHNGMPQIAILLFSKCAHVMQLSGVQLSKSTWKQECIPVGCVPAERWPYSGGEPPPPPKKNWRPPQKFGGPPPKLEESPPENLQEPPPPKLEEPPLGPDTTHTPCEQNEWQTLVKILPWPKLRFGR